jgi:hypothetical protein
MAPHRALLKFFVQCPSKSTISFRAVKLKRVLTDSELPMADILSLPDSADAVLTMVDGQEGLRYLAFEESRQKATAQASMNGASPRGRCVADLELVFVCCAPRQTIALRRLACCLALCAIFRLQYRSVRRREENSDSGRSFQLAGSPHLLYIR